MLSGQSYLDFALSMSPRCTYIYDFVFSVWHIYETECIVITVRLLVDTQSQNTKRTAVNHMRAEAHGHDS